MECFLVRHGNADVGPVDIERPLSIQGRFESRSLAQALLEKKVRIDHIYHSGYLRAFETAKIIAEEMDLTVPLEIGFSMGPESDPFYWRDELNHLKQNVMLVGHNPYMECLSSFLLEGKAMKFGTANLLALHRLEFDKYKFLFMIK